MKTNTHPTWYHDAQVTCACGNSFTTGSTQKILEVDICDECHPFFTGEMKFVDRQGRVDKFKKKMAAAQAKKAAKAKSQKKSKKEDNKSYQDILREKRSQLRKSDKKDSKAK